MFSENSSDLVARLVPKSLICNIFNYGQNGPLWLLQTTLNDFDNWTDLNISNALVLLLLSSISLSGCIST